MSGINSLPFSMKKSCLLNSQNSEPSAYHKKLIELTAFADKRELTNSKPDQQIIDDD
jgi:hypothetical protein